MKSFSNPAQSWEQILAWIVKTQIGREVLNQFRQQIAANQVRIEPYPRSIHLKLQALSEEKSQPAPLGAAFITDGKNGTVYLDTSGPLGVLVPFLFHEMIHSLDDSLWKAARNYLRPSLQREVLFAAECRAFHAQHHFLEQLKLLHPEYRAYCKTWEVQFPFLNREFLPHEIAHLYRSIDGEVTPLRRNTSTLGT